MNRTSNRFLFQLACLLSILVFFFVISIVSAQDTPPEVPDPDQVQSFQPEADDPETIPEAPGPANQSSEDEIEEPILPTEAPEPTATVEIATLKQQAISKGSVPRIVAPDFLSESDLSAAVSYDNIDQLTLINSEHPYAPNTLSIIKFSLQDAVRLRIRFDSKFHLETGYDSLALYQFDPLTNTFRIVNKTYSGTDLAGQEVEITGDTVYFRFETDESVEAYGWQVADIQADYPEPADEAGEPSADTAPADPAEQPEPADETGDPSAAEVSTPEASGIEPTAASTATPLAPPTQTAVPTATPQLIPTITPSQPTEAAKSIFTNLIEYNPGDAGLPDDPSRMVNRSLAAPKILKIWQDSHNFNGIIKPVLAIQITPAAGILDYQVAISTTSPTTGFSIRPEYFRPNNSIFKFALPVNQTVYIKIAAVKDNKPGPFSNVVGGRINIGLPTMNIPTKVNASQVRLSWNAVPGATGYRIWRSETSATSGYGWVVTVGNTTSVVSSITSSSKTYYYRVAAIVANMVGPMSSPKSYRASLPAPTLNPITRASATSLRLSWTAVPGATGYRIWRSETSASSGYGWIVTIGNVTSTVTSVPSSKTYYYKVAAISGSTVGTPSAPRAGTTALLGKPTLNPITATSVENAVRVSWTAVPGATGYRVWRSETSASSGFAWAVNVGNVTAITTSVSPWKTYYYKVAAIKGTTVGTASNPRSIDYRPFTNFQEIETEDDTKLHITWNPVENATGYRIWRSETSSASGFNWITTVGNTTELTIDAIPGKPYFFKIAPMKNSIIGKLNTAVEAVAMGKTCLFKKDIDEYGIHLYWRDVEGATGYRLWYREHQWDHDDWLFIDLDRIPTDFSRQEYYFQPENHTAQYDLQISALFRSRVGPRCLNTQTFMLDKNITYRAILIDFGTCQNTTAMLNTDLVNLGNTLRNTNQGYKSQFDGVFGPYCPTKTGWLAPFNQIGYPDQNDITFIYISGFGKYLNNEALLEIGENSFVNGTQLYQTLIMNGYLGGKMHIIVSSFINQDSATIDLWRSHFINGISGSLKSHAMVWPIPSNYDRDWVAYELRRGISSNGRLCPIDNAWSDDGSDLDFPIAWFRLGDFLIHLPVEIMGGLDYFEDYDSFVELPFIICSPQ